MPSPVYVAGTYGNLIAQAVIPHVTGGVTTNAAALLDLSAALEGQVSFQIVAGASPPTAGTVCSAYKVYGPGPATTITTFTDSTHVIVGSVVGLNVGQKILIQKAGTAPQLGETVQISAIASLTLTFATALVRTYTAGDKLYLMNRTAVASKTPASLTGTWAANITYSDSISLGTGQYAIEMANTDTANDTTCACTVDRVDGFA